MIWSCKTIRLRPQDHTSCDAKGMVSQGKTRRNIKCQDISYTVKGNNLTNKIENKRAKWTNHNWDKSCLADIARPSFPAHFSHSEH